MDEKPCSRKRSSDGTMGDPALDWSSLHGDVVNAVARKITAIEDYVRFRAVCKSWRSAAPARPRHLHTQVPWLMLHSSKAASGPMDMAFFSIAKRQFIRLPGTGKAPFRCSSHGWLVVGENGYGSASLLNPITGATRPLSVCWNRNFLRKVVLCSDPAIDRDVVVMAVHHSRSALAFCRLGDDLWKWMTPPPIADRDRIEDVAYHKGQFYCVFASGRVALCDLGPPPSIKLITEASAHVDRSQFHLVESREGKLLLVSQYECAVRFEVFELEVDDRPKVSKLTGIGDNALFLSREFSVAVSAAHFPGIIQGNSIYAVDTNHASSGYGKDATNSGAVNQVYTIDSDGDDPTSLQCRHNIFVFNLADGNKNLLHLLYGSVLVQPLWFMPSLCQ